MKIFIAHYEEVSDDYIRPGDLTIFPFDFHLANIEKDLPEDAQPIGKDRRQDFASGIFPINWYEQSISRKISEPRYQKLLGRVDTIAQDGNTMRAKIEYGKDQYVSVEADSLRKVKAYRCKPYVLALDEFFTDLPKGLEAKNLVKLGKSNNSGLARYIVKDSEMDKETVDNFVATFLRDKTLAYDFSAWSPTDNIYHQQFSMHPLLTSVEKLLLKKASDKFSHEAITRIEQLNNDKTDKINTNGLEIKQNAMPPEFQEMTTMLDEEPYPFSFVGDHSRIRYDVNNDEVVAMLSMYAGIVIQEFTKKMGVAVKDDVLSATSDAVYMRMTELDPRTFFANYEKSILPE